MANVKITGLTAITAPANTDVLPIVDVSADVTKKVSIADLLESAGDGTAALPAFAFDSDKDIGMYRVGANQLGFATAGTSRIVVDASGNVGIGTSSPSRLLTVAGISRFENFIEFGGSISTPATAAAIYRPADNNLAFSTASNERLRIDSSGNVGIGTTSPSYLLDLSNSSNAYLRQTRGSNAFRVGPAGDQAGDGVILGTDTNGPLRFFTNSSSNERMRINSSGNVGINNSNPRGLLHVGPDLASGATDAAAINLKQSSTTAATGIYLERSGERKGYAIYLGGDQDSLNFQRNNAGAKSDVLTLNRDGNVGIGTSSPVANSRGIDIMGITDASLRLHTGATGSTSSDGALFSIDANNAAYLWNYENQHFIFGTNNTERMRIDSSGNVGIGASNPINSATFNTLHIGNGSSTAGQIALKNTANQNFFLWHSSTAVNIYNGSATPQIFYTAATERMRINSSGNVGIGTTSPATLLHLETGHAKQTLKSTNTNTASSIIFDTTNVTTADFLLGQLAGKWNGTDVAYINFEAGSDTTNKDDGIISFLTSAASGSPTERMRITSAGNVGIGTTAPTPVLAGSGRSLTIAGTVHSEINFLSASNAFGSLYFGDATSGAQRYAGYLEYSHADDYMRLGTGTLERLRITNAGYVGIGTSTPHTIGNPGIIFNPDSFGTGIPFTGVGVNSSSNSHFEWAVYSTSLLQYQFYVTLTGTIFARSASISVISDQREKENIVALETGLNEIMALKPRRFDWKDGTKQNIAGFVAQEVETILPDLVEEQKIDITDETRKTLRMGDMIPTLVNAIQEQQAVIEALEAKVAALEAG